MINLYILVVTTLVVFLVQHHWKRRRLYKLGSKLPSYDGLPFFKSLFYKLELLMEPKCTLLKMEKLINCNQPITKHWFFGDLIVMTKNADIVNKFLNLPQTYNRPNELTPSLGAENSLINLNGSIHKRHRKILNKAISPRMLRQYPEIFDANSIKMLNKLKEEVGRGEFDIFDYVGAYALKNISRSVFNFKVDGFRSQLFKKLCKFPNYVVQFTPLVYFGFNRVMISWTETGRKFEKSFQAFEYHARNIIQWNQKNPGDEKNMVINLLLNPENSFTDKEIQDELLGLYIVGFDTSARALATVAMMLGMHQEVQQKLYEEIHQLYNIESETRFTLDFLKKFKYLEAVLNETLRLFPTVPLLVRRVSEDTEINGYLFPEDTILATSLYGIHRDKKYWGRDAHLFRPERFLEKIEKPNAFMPFGAGKRICFGYRYSMMALKVFFINFLRTYRVFCSTKYVDIKIEFMISLTFADGYKISIENR